MPPARRQAGLSKFRFSGIDQQVNPNNANSDAFSNAGPVNLNIITLADSQFQQQKQSIGAAPCKKKRKCKPKKKCCVVTKKCCVKK